MLKEHRVKLGQESEGELALQHIGSDNGLMPTHSRLTRVAYCMDGYSLGKGIFYGHM